MSYYCAKLKTAELYFRCHESDGGFRLTPYSGVAGQAATPEAAMRNAQILNRMYPGLEFVVVEILNI